jgi:hypothetical protein
MGIAVAAVFILPDLPTNTRGFTADELEVAQLRMTEDVGLADVDPEGLGTFGGLTMALKDIKVYIMCIVFTTYVIGLSFNAYFVSFDPFATWKLSTLIFGCSLHLPRLLVSVMFPRCS